MRGKRSRGAALALAAVLAIVGAGYVGLRVSAVAGSQIAQQELTAVRQDSGRGECVGIGDLHAEPRTALGGQPITLTATFSAVCAGGRFANDVAILVEAHDDPRGARLERQKEAARSFVTGLERYWGLARIGVLAHGGGQVWEACPLQEDLSAVQECIGDIQPRGAPELPQALAASEQLLLSERLDNYDPQLDNNVVLVLHEGLLTEDQCRSAIQHAESLKRNDIAVIPRCVREPCAEACLDEMARALPLQSASIATGLDGGLPVAANTIIRILIRDLHFRAELGEGMRVASDTVRPAPSRVDPDGRWLAWHTDFVPKEGVTFTWSVQTERRGPVQLTRGVTAAYTNNLGKSGKLPYDDAYGMVLEPRPLPTATSVRRYLPAAGRSSGVRQ